MTVPPPGPTTPAASASNSWVIVTSTTLPGEPRSSSLKVLRPSSTATSRERIAVFALRSEGPKIRVPLSVTAPAFELEAPELLWISMVATPARAGKDLVCVAGWLTPRVNASGPIRMASTASEGEAIAAAATVSGQ